MSNPDKERATVSLVDAAARLGISESHARNLVRANTFPVPVIRMGRVTRVATAELDRILGVPHDAA